MYGPCFIAMAHSNTDRMGWRRARAVSAGPRQLAVGERLFAGFRERDKRAAAEPEFAASPADDEPLDLASGAGRLDGEVQAVAFSVPS